MNQQQSDKIDREIRRERRRSERLWKRRKREESQVPYGGSIVLHEHKAVFDAVILPFFFAKLAVGAFAILGTMILIWLGIF